MTPADLDAYLTVLRKHGAMTASFAPGNVFSVVFGPDSAPLPPGDELTPGGWKTPPLDEAYEPEGRLP